MGNAHEDVPEEVITQAKAAFVRRGRGDIAVLAWDSLVDADAHSEDHGLRFEHPDVQIDVRIVAAGSSSDLEVQLIPPLSVLADLEADSGALLGKTQAMNGAFGFGSVPPGVVRLQLQGSGTPEVHTDWFRI